MKGTESSSVVTSWSQRFLGGPFEGPRRRLVAMRRPMTVSLDELLLDTLRDVAADEGVPEDRIVEEALRRYFGLRGLAVLDQVGERRRAEGTQLSDDEAMALAIAEVRAARAERVRARGA